MRRPAITALALGFLAFATSGCTSSSGADATLSALVPETTSQGVLAAPPASSLPSPATQTASVPAGTRIAFAAVMGAPDKAIAPLSRELSARAKMRGLTVAPAGKPDGNYVLKGYFSTMDEAGAGSVVYVWDVVDAAGKRLYRIQGQERLAANGGWKAVTDATMQSIANKTIDQFATWLSQPAG